MTDDNQEKKDDVPRFVKVTLKHGDQKEVLSIDHLHALSDQKLSIIGGSAFMGACIPLLVFLAMGLLVLISFFPITADHEYPLFTAYTPYEMPIVLFMFCSISAVHAYFVAKIVDSINGQWAPFALTENVYSRLEDNVCHYAGSFLAFVLVVSVFLGIVIGCFQAAKLKRVPLGKIAGDLKLKYER